MLGGDQRERRFMKIAIIGCGYVGKAVAHHWHNKLGYVITATTTTPGRVAELETLAHEVIVLKGDDADTLTSAIQNQDVVLLSMGAANSTVYEETYLGTAKTLVAALKQTSTVKQVIYTGSYSVYGDKKGEWVDEDSPVTPANQNGEILTETEQVLLAASSPNLKVCIFRLGGIYGPGRELIKIFGRAAGTTRPGAGEDFTNWIHLKDIVGALTFAVEYQLQGIYNLVGDVPMPSRELLERLFEQHGLPKVSWDSSVPSQRPYNARVSNQKLKAAGYRFAYPEIEEY
jgi:nucleoside-diphosphate-sugar epimerase